MEEPYLMDGFIYNSKLEKIMLSNKRNSDLLYYKTNKSNKSNKSNKIRKIDNIDINKKRKIQVI